MKFFDNITAAITVQYAKFDNIEKQLHPLTLQANDNSEKPNKQDIGIYSM